MGPSLLYRFLWGVIQISSEIPIEIFSLKELKRGISGLIPVFIRAIKHRGKVLPIGILQQNLNSLSG